MLRRAGLFKAFDSAFRRGSYDDEEDAIARARERRDLIERSSSFDRAPTSAVPELLDAPTLFDQGECEQ